MLIFLFHTYIFDKDTKNEINSYQYYLILG